MLPYATHAWPADEMAPPGTQVCTLTHIRSLVQPLMHVPYVSCKAPLVVTRPEHRSSPAMPLDHSARQSVLLDGQHKLECQAPTHTPAGG
jgi:hypothetical protein